MIRLIEQYRFHNLLFKNVLKGIKVQDTHIRINGKTNHIAWIAGNLVSVRYRLANSLGLDVKESFYEYFEHQRPIQDGLVYPELPKMLEEWEVISPVLEKRLSELTQQELAAESPFSAPQIAHDNLLGTINFLIDREAYAIGQLGLMRKAFGYEAMSYS